MFSSLFLILAFIFYHIIFDMSCKAIKKFLSIPVLNSRYLLYNVRKPFIFFGGTMKNFRNYLQLHLNILLFSLTSVFSKLASIQYNQNGLHAPLLYVFLFLMIANCGIYAIAWQQVIKKFSLSTAYANKSVYLLWSQIWAVIIFHEQLSPQNILGILIVLFGVWTVQRYE